MPQKRYLLTPGPTPVPPEVLAAMGEPVIHHRSPDFKSAVRRDACALAAGLPDGQRGAASSPRRAPALSSRRSRICSRPARRCLRSRTASSAPLAEDGGGVRLRRRRRSTYDVGRDARAPRISPRRSPTRGAEVVVARPLGDVDRRRRRHPAARCRVPTTRARSSSSTRSRASAPSRWRPTPGVSTSSSSGSQKALMTPPGLALASVSRACLGAAASATMPRFYFDWRRYREGQEKDNTPFTPAVVDRRRRSTSHSAASSTKGSRTLRPARRARSRLPRGREGDGARAVLAGRRSAGGRHGDPHARGRRRQGAACSRCATATASRSPAVTATSSTGSSASVTSAGSTSSTSRPRSPRSSSSSPTWARRSSAAPPCAAALEAYAEAVDRSVRVLVREAIAEAGVELLRSRFEVDVDARRRPRGDHRPLRRDRHPLGDEAHGRPDRAGRRA